MEDLKNLIETLKEQNFTFNYGENNVKIKLDTLLSDYDDGTSFIDYISDFYYVQSVYNKLNHDTDPTEIFQNLSENSESYYKLLSLVKFYYSELISCLESIQSDLENKENSSDYIFASVKAIPTINFKYQIFEIYSCDNECHIDINLEYHHIYKNKILTELIMHLSKTSNPYVKLFFLEVILELIINDKLNVRLDSNTINNLETFFSKIESLTDTFKDALRKRISDNMFCFVSGGINDWFGKLLHNNELSNTLKSLTGKNKRNLTCYAVAYKINRKSKEILYYAINHLDGKERDNLHSIFSKLLPNVKAAKLTDGVRYYLPNDDFIEYKQFKTFPNIPNGNFNRMFTCCERKFFAKLRNKESNINEMNILVTQAPCVYCSRELNCIKKNDSVTIKINYPELERINTHDNLAQIIYENSIEIKDDSTRKNTSKTETSSSTKPSSSSSSYTQATDSESAQSDTKTVAGSAPTTPAQQQDSGVTESPKKTMLNPEYHSHIDENGYNSLLGAYVLDNNNGGNNSNASTESSSVGSSE